MFVPQHMVKLRPLRSLVVPMRYIDYLEFKALPIKIQLDYVSRLYLLASFASSSVESDRALLTELLG